MTFQLPPDIDDIPGIAHAGFLFGWSYGQLLEATRHFPDKVAEYSKDCERAWARLEDRIRHHRSLLGPLDPLRGYSGGEAGMEADADAHADQERGLL